MDMIFKTAVVVVPSDTDDIPNPSQQDGKDNRGCFLYIGAAGNVKVTTVGGQTLTINAPAIGRVLPLQVVKVFATGGTTVTAGNIIAFWR